MKAVVGRAIMVICGGLMVCELISRECAPKPKRQQSVSDTKLRCWYVGLEDGTAYLKVEDDNSLTGTTPSGKITNFSPTGKDVGAFLHEINSSEDWRCYAPPEEEFAYDRRIR